LKAVAEARKSKKLSRPYGGGWPQHKSGCPPNKVKHNRLQKKEKDSKTNKTLKQTDKINN
jgi:hypothetical protein